MLKILKNLGKVLQVIVTVLLALLLVSNLYLIFMEKVLRKENPTIFGYSVTIVASGSMQPALSVDDLILNCVQENYDAGDIITFQSGDNLVTHRIVGVDEKGFVTQGDANNAADIDRVPSENIVGRVKYKIPYVGKCILFFKTPLGMMLLIFIGFLLIEFPFFFQKQKL